MENIANIQQELLNLISTLATEANKKYERDFSITDMTYERYSSVIFQINILFLGAWIALFTVDKLDLSHGIALIIGPMIAHLIVLHSAAVGLWLSMRSGMRSLRTQFVLGQRISEISKLVGSINDHEAKSKLQELKEKPLPVVNSIDPLNNWTQKIISAIAVWMLPTSGLAAILSLSLILWLLK